MSKTQPNMNPGKPEPRRCRGKNRQGNPCGRPPIRGGFVCPKHGGGLPRVRAKANGRLADLIDPDRALREAARIAYSDPRKLFGPDGALLKAKDWSDEVAASIASIEVVKRNVDSGDGKTDDVIKLKVWDKPKSLEMLFKHLGLLKDQVEHTGAIEVRWKE